LGESPVRPPAGTGQASPARPNRGKWTGGAGGRSAGLPPGFVRRCSDGSEGTRVGGPRRRGRRGRGAGRRRPAPTTATAAAVLAVGRVVGRRRRRRRGGRARRGGAVVAGRLGVGEPGAAESDHERGREAGAREFPSDAAHVGRSFLVTSVSE